MPANLTPDYRDAEARFRAARSPSERKTALEDMLATIPKHKGTEKLQADIKRRLARLREEEQARSGKKGFSIKVLPEGAAQVVLLGPPNCGKSSLLKSLTRAEPVIGDYPFTTTLPLSGMMPVEDVQVQLVDLPPVTCEHLDPWLPDVLRGADAALLLADPTSTRIPDDVEEVRARLVKARVPLIRELTHDADFRDAPLRTMLVFTKADQARSEDIDVLKEMFGGEFPIASVSALKGVGLEELKFGIWDWLELVRVYSKPPNKPVDRSVPFVLHRGATVHDLAERIHRELAERLAFARVWGGEIQGLRAARDFVLRDRDVVELHF